MNPSLAKSRPDRPRTEQSRPASILVVDDEPGIRDFLQRALAKRHGLVEVAENVDTADELCQRYHFDLLIVDIRLPGRSGLDWVMELRAAGNDMDVIFITAYADMDATIGALRTGAADFVLKPFRVEQILTAVERCFERRRLARENTALRRQVDTFVDRLYGASGMIGQSAPMQEVGEIIRQIAPTPTSVLIEGETGTGKELAARAIHRLSKLSGPLVPVNCVAISPDLLESELFGHTKGAFTGAHQARDGLFSFATGGILFLDEISEMPGTMQAKLLRVLESRRIRPVGSDRELAVDARIVTATNKNLAEEVRKGRFREDLFYRLNVVTIKMPTLRQRPEDIPELVDFLGKTLAAELGVAPPTFSREDIHALQAYNWPGNVRELRNLIERAVLLGRLPSDIMSIQGSAPGRESPTSPFPAEWTLAEVEKSHMRRVLESAGGNKSEAARRLGISRKTLERKLRSDSALTRT
ncbi:MAG: sigma-54 dependent transcriptional regulator [Gammaproteobacteria bacterium]|nr:sigma-54 dependent transcriptional regulator [Gammaproteobacteria bacterium]